MTDGNRDLDVAALFDANYVALRRLAYAILGDGGAAEEVVMDAFVKVCSDPWRFRRLQIPSIYLRRVVVNACRSRLRRSRFEHRANQLVSPPDDGVIDANADVYLDTLNAVRRLPLRQRACVCLRYLEDLSEAEIAEVLDCSIGTVKSQLHKARGTLRRLLDESVEGASDGRA